MNKNNVVCQSINTMLVTNKSLVPHKFYSILDILFIKCQSIVKQMLADRTKISTKYWHGIPSVVSKSLISKYQKNKQCKSVKNLAIQICGDKGKQVKLETNNKIRIPAIFKKETIDIIPLKPIFGHICSIEFFRKKSKWFMSYTYNTPCNAIEIKGFVGVDRNARENVATLAHLETGHVERLGPDIKIWKDNFKNRKAKLQSGGATCLLKKINKKQSNRSKDINHKVSRKIVDYAAKHQTAIVLEDLGSIRDSKKCGHYVKKSNWSYYQLEQYIKYKACLCGIPIVYIDPRNTSKRCSKCGHINTVVGKHFKCVCCGHEDNRDSNAGFNIAIKGRDTLCFNYNLVSFISISNERELLMRPIDGPLTGKGFSNV